MSFSYKITLRLKKEQIEKINQDSKRKGFRYSTDYMRWILIEKNTETEEKINLIYNMLKKNGEERKQ